jgi:lysophospholipase L1-like esterase
MSTRRRLGLTAAALLAGLLLAEAIVRVRFADEVDTERIRRAREALDVSPLLRGSADPQLVFEARPNLDLRLAGWRVVTDGNGLRMRDTPPSEPTPAGEPLRIAVVGASGSFGLGVQAGQAWPWCMADRLQAVLDHPVEVLNVSVSAYVATQEARIFELRALPWHPDLVVWHYDHRDAFPVDPPGKIIVPGPEEGDNPLHSALLKLILRRCRVAALQQPEYLMVNQQRSADGYFCGGPLYDAHLDALSRVGAQCRAQGISLALFVFDAFLSPGHAAQRHYDTLHAPLLPALRAAGFRVLDLQPCLLEVMQQRGWKDLSAWWRSAEPLDGYFNAEGNAWLAERLAAWLTSDGKILR